MASNHSIAPESRPIVERLDRFAARPDVLAALRQARVEADTQLQREPALAAAVVAVYPSLFGNAVPAEVGSIRVVVTRDAGGDAVERHANCAQYLLVLDGPVETHVQTADGWRIDRYAHGDSAELEERWHVVPPGVWHRTVAPSGACHWWVVAFHSARDVSDEYR